VADAGAVTIRVAPIAAIHPPALSASGWREPWHLSYLVRHTRCSYHHTGGGIMSQDAMSDDSSAVFTFRPWRPEHESWDAFLGELETAYAQYLDGYRQGIRADQATQDQDPDEQPG
jgi:hypothetical protein